MQVRLPWILPALLALLAGCATRTPPPPPDPAPSPAPWAVGAAPVRHELRLVSADLDRDWSAPIHTVTAGLKGRLVIEYRQPFATTPTIYQSPDLIHWAPVLPITMETLQIAPDGSQTIRATFSAIPTIEETSPSAQFFKIAP